MICTVSMPAMSSKNQPQLVYMSWAWRCISINSRARMRSSSLSGCDWCASKKRSTVFRAAIEHDLDVGVARGPDVLEKLRACLFGERNERVAQLVESLAQRRAPGLVPARLAAVAAAVRAPALDAMRAAPRGVFDDFALELRRKLLEKARRSW